MAEIDKEKLSEENVLDLLDSLYDKCVTGIPMVSDSVEEMAKDYLKDGKSQEEACQEMQKYQIIKCTTSGFITGFGGIITLPVTVPANVSSVLYVQIRMIACTAYMAGYELNSDQTKTFIYACLAGISVNQLIKTAAKQFGIKLTTKLIEKIPGKVLTKINQKVGFRFLTKFGTKGVINFGKLVPGVGAVIGGGFDFVETKIIANRAYKWFIEGDFSTDEKNDDKDNIIDIEPDDFIENNESQESNKEE